MRTERKIAASGVNDAKLKTPVTIIGRAVSLTDRDETGMPRKLKISKRTQESGDYPQK